MAGMNQIFYKGKTHKKAHETAMMSERDVPEYEVKTFLHHFPTEQEEIFEKTSSMN